MLTITVPFSEFLSILFGDFPDIKTRSNLVDGDPIPRVVSKGVGLVLESLDPTEDQIKVFIYEDHAEVWRSLDWRESLTHRTQLKEAQEKGIRRFYLKEAILKHLLENLNFPSCAETRRLAEVFALCEGKGEICVKFGIDKVVEEYKRKYESSN